MEKLTYTHNADAAAVIAQTYDTPPLAYVRSYGCQQNVNDGEKIRGVLMDIGFGICDSVEQADLILFNTCAVREHAEQRVFGNVGALKKLKEKNPRLIIGVCGCMAQQKHIVDKLRASYPYVDLVFGVDGIDRLPAMLVERLHRGKRYLETPVERNAVVEELPIRRDSGFRAWLPIMYGCDNFCTYCIVPYVRGRERSRTPADVLAEFKTLVEQGYKEITLLGQNVNSYGKGLEEKTDFADLLNLLCTVPGDYQIRFMTSHPKDASRKLIDTIAAQDHLCKHIHLPVQSGDSDVLRRMGRRYSIEQYRALFDRIKAAIPECGISTDIIVGFPNESDEQFQHTLDIVDYCRFDNAYTFIYSPREGTPAARMEDSVPLEVKQQRLAQLNARWNAHALEKNKAYVGRRVKVLVDGPSKKDEHIYSGYTETNKLVNFTAENAQAGDIVEVIITEARTWSLKGEEARS